MPPATVLVVDDEPLIRWSVKERLAGAGHEVLEAETAADARRRATAWTSCSWTTACPMVTGSRS